MPPKTSQKRSRESTGTATNKQGTAATAVPSAPGSAPPLRRGRSSSVTSQDEGNTENDVAPRAKRTRREKTSGRESGASDASMDEDEERREEREGGQDVGNGKTAGSASASSSRKSATTKKATGGRRRASAAASAAFVTSGGQGEVGHNSCRCGERRKIGALLRSACGVRTCGRSCYIVAPRRMILPPEDSLQQ